MVSEKYPRTLHLPWSPGATSDDRFITEEELDYFLDKEIIITEKLDGSNTCLTKDDVFARSHGGPPSHPSFNLLKNIHAQLILEENHSYFGEWCYAVHSIKYDILQDYWNLFGIRNDKTREWYSWDDVETYAELLNMTTAPVLIRAFINNIEHLKYIVEALCSHSSCYGKEREGVVVRVNDGVSEKKDERGTVLMGVAKWVREDHVQSDQHWTKNKVEVQPCVKYPFTF